MSQVKRTYPIVKYPKNIERKLKSRSPVAAVHQVEIDEDVFADLFPAPPARTARKYPQYLLWGLMGLWVLMLGGVAVKVISAGVLVAAVALSAVTVAVAGKQIWADSAVEKVRVDRAKSLSPPVERKELKPSVIDWSENVAEIVRSSKTSTAQVGVSEERFLAHMQKMLPGRISFGHVYLPQGYNHAYSADMEIILPCGLVVQVEIDEPYVGKTREPHHCWDNDKDTKRDNFFTGIGWVIIRFSEKQVVTDPDGCCGAITKLIMELTQDTKLTKVAELADKLKPDPQWSAQQSQMMEKLKTREKYLSAAGLWNDSKRKSK